MTQKPDAEKNRAELIAELQALRSRLEPAESRTSAHSCDPLLARQQSADLRGCFDHVPFELWTLDAHGRYLYQNASCREHLGDLIGRSDSEVSTSNGWRECNLRALKGERVRSEVTCTRGGRDCVLLADVSPIKSNGSVEMVVGAAVDVTDACRSEDQLIFAEEAWRSLVAHSPDIITVVDREGTVLFANRTVPTTSVDEVIGTNIFDYVDEEYRADAGKQVRRVYETGECSMLRVAGDVGGARYWFESHLGPITRDGRIVAVACVTVDVTERESAMSSLLESESRFRFTFEQAGVGIALLSPDCRWIRVNQKLCDILGYSAKELLSLSISELADPIEADGDALQIARLLAGEIKTCSDERRYRTRSGAVIWVDVTMALAQSEPGKPRYLIAVFKDVTDRKRAEDELGRVTDHLEQRLRQRTAALADANEMLQREIVERTAAVERLQIESDRRRELEEIVHLSTAVAFRWKSDRGWPVEFVSENVSRFGYNAEQFTSGRLKYADLIHPDDLPAIEAAIENAEQSRQTQINLSYRIIDGAGETRWVEERSWARRDESGRVTHYFGVVFDNTSYRRVEERLKILSSAVEQSTEGVAVIDRDGEVLFANRAFAKMHGVDAAMIQGGNVSMLRTRDGRLPLLEAMGQAWKSGECASEITLPLQRDTGSPALLHCCVLRDDVGREIGVIATISDLSDLRRATNELQDSERRFRQLSAAAFEGIAIHQLGRILDANQAMADLFGYERTELIGMLRMDLIAPENRDAMRQFIREHVGDEDMPRYETMGLRRDGHKFPILIRGRAIPFEGRVGQVLAVQDITEEKRAAEMWQKRLSDLAHFQRLSTMGELAAGLAHELNQPLSAISNYTQGCVRRLEKGAIEHSELIERLGQVAGQALRAGKIIARLRQFIKRREPRRADVRLVDLLRESVEFVHPDLKQAEINCEIDIPDKSPMIQADPVHLQQVIVNLIRNACEAIVEKKPPERKIIIRVRITADNSAEVVVLDSAGSLPPELLNLAFEHFFTTKPEGLGMGLVISRSLIEAQGGVLTAKRDGGEWTSFSFTVPLAQSADPDLST